MKRFILFFICLLTIFLSGRSANAGFVEKDIARIEACGEQFKGSQVTTCVAVIFRNCAKAFAERSSSPAGIKAAQILQNTASGLSGGISKPAALSVLNRARSIAAGLASQSDGKAQEIYSGLSTVFARAINVIQRKA